MQDCVDVMGVVPASSAITCATEHDVTDVSVAPAELVQCMASCHSVSEVQVVHPVCIYV